MRTCHSNPGLASAALKARQSASADETPNAWQPIADAHGICLLHKHGLIAADPVHGEIGLADPNADGPKRVV